MNKNYLIDSIRSNDFEYVANPNSLLEIIVVQKNFEAIIPFQMR